MKLVDLSPKWLSPSLFVFLCPHCHKDWLVCKSSPMMMRDQFALFEKHFGESWPSQVVPASPEFSWSVSSSDFATLSVSPSIDASASGHWHGYITNGEIR